MKNTIATTRSELQELVAYGPEYARQALKPDWYEAAEDESFGIAISATSGTSPFNEWYLFQDREQAVEYMAKNFQSQSMLDGFQFAQGEFYDAEDIFAALNEQFGEDHEYSEVIDQADLTSLTPSDLSSLVEAESSF